MTPPGPGGARRNRRRFSAPHAHQDRWLVSYADLITLLFAFFTTMYAISTVDARKLQDMVESMHAAFDANKPLPTKSIDVKTSNDHRLLDRASLEALRQRLAQRLALQITGGQVGLEIDPRGLVVTIREAGTFAVGSADLSDSAKAVLAEVSEALKDIDNPVRVEGHTDDVPIHTARYRSNWELSTARATNVIAFLMEERGMPASRFSAAGYGEFHPRSPNSNAANRAENRRVDIVILNAQTQAAEEPKSPTAPAAPRPPAAATPGTPATPRVAPAAPAR